MRIDHSPLVCKACGHMWQQEMLYDVPVNVWVAHVRSLHCPQCHADSHHLAFQRDTRVDFREERTDGLDTADQPDRCGTD